MNELKEYSGLDERSDGLRQFVALHAFALRNRSTSPILLIDEAEQRLHYDAQADLVQMLAKQNVAPKVIYTTHSAGCLPEDLGNGVRLTKPAGKSLTASQIVNKFWAEEGDALVSLLLGMGASTMAFFPMRRAVLVEGPVDILLYPTMFREILSADVLGFQFVSGLSTTGQTLAPLLSGEDGHIGYLTDGDLGGAAISDKLQEAGVSKSRIVTLRNANSSAVEIEDFIEPSLLLRAANKLINQYYPEADLLAKSDLQPNRRTSGLEVAYLAATGNRLPKVELAYEILDALDEAPVRPIIDPSRRIAFGKVVASVVDLFPSK